MIYVTFLFSTELPFMSLFYVWKCTRFNVISWCVCKNWDFLRWCLLWAFFTCINKKIENNSFIFC